MSLMPECHCRTQTLDGLWMWPLLQSPQPLGSSTLMEGSSTDDALCNQSPAISSRTVKWDRNILRIKAEIEPRTPRAHRRAAERNNQSSLFKTLICKIKNCLKSMLICNILQTEKLVQMILLPMKWAYLSKSI